MGLTNSEFNLIMDDYEAAANNNRAVHGARVQEIYKSIPEIREIDENIITVSAEHARNAVLGRHAEGSLKDKLREYEVRKKQLLIKAGYSEDYLEPVYNCKECRDTGFVNGRICSCLNRAIIKRLYEQSNIEEMLEKENFDTFEIEYFSEEKDKTYGISPRENMKDVLAAARMTADSVGRDHKNILLYGGTGVGKTFISNCIAKSVMDRGCSVIYLSAQALVEAFERSTFGKDTEDDAYAGFIFDCDLLIIDDLGTEFSNSFTNSKLFTCINERIMRKRSTVISTNLSLEQIRDNYSDRIFSRLIRDYRILYIFGDDIRIRKAIS